MLSPPNPGAAAGGGAIAEPDALQALLAAVFAPGTEPDPLQALLAAASSPEEGPATAAVSPGPSGNSPGVQIVQAMPGVLQARLAAAPTSMPLVSASGAQASTLLNNIGSTRASNLVDGVSQQKQQEQQQWQQRQSENSPKPAAVLNSIASNVASATAGRTATIMQSAARRAGPFRGDG